MHNSPKLMDSCGEVCTVIEIPMANKDRKIEALMVILERSWRTICLKLNAFCNSWSDIDNAFLFTCICHMQ